LLPMPLVLALGAAFLFPNLVGPPPDAFLAIGTGAGVERVGKVALVGIGQGFPGGIPVDLRDICGREIAARPVLLGSLPSGRLVDRAGCTILGVVTHVLVPPLRERNTK